MKLLLDTQALLWWVNDNPKLGPLAKNAIADRGNDVFVSVASFWEISIKHRIGKLEDSGPTVYQEALDNGFEVLGIEGEHLRHLESFESRPDHRDPFDLLILVQAIASDAILVTADRKMRSYNLRCL